MNETHAMVSQFERRAEGFLSVVQGGAGRLDAPSPCAGWSAADVIDHVLTTQRDFLAERGLRLEVEPSGDPVADVENQLGEIRTLLADDEVAGLRYDSHFGPTTIAATMADFYGWDMVLHGWDVAKATGQEISWTEDEVAALRSTAESWGPAIRMEGICGPEVAVPETASAQDQLLGFLGRDPRVQI